MTARKILPSILIYLVFFIPVQHAEAQRTKSSLSAGEQRSAEKGLKDNRYFFYFLNSSVSNLGNDDEKALYREAVQRDLIAQQLYMKFLFHESFIEVRHSQKLLINCYRRVLRRDIAATGVLLNEFAAEVLHGDDARARNYLHLGYREREVSSQFFVMADNYQEQLYSLRLYKYVKAIKNAKQGKRYALLAMISIRTPHDQALHNPLTFKDIMDRIGQVGGERKTEFIRLHYDNYYTAEIPPSLYDRVWEKPSLNEIPEYGKYLEIQ